MKTKLLLSVIAAIHLQAVTAKAQITDLLPSKIDTNGVYQKKGSYLQLGVGYPNLVFLTSDIAKTIFGSAFDTKKEGLLTFVAGYEYGLFPRLSIGLNATYASGSYTYSDKQNPASFFKYSGTFYTIGLRGSYHILVTKKWDVYSGAMLAYKKSNLDISSSSSDIATLLTVLSGISNDDAGKIGYDAFLGAKYFPSMKPGNVFGFFIEAGYGVTILKVGLALNMLTKK